MVPETDEPISDEQKVKICSDFVLSSPPGEFGEVFNDLRFLVGNEGLLKDVARKTFAEYYKTQLIPVKIEGSDYHTLITDFNDVGNDRFYDPRTRQSFMYDFVRKLALDFKTHDPEPTAEPWRRALEETCTAYTEDYHKQGVCCVFGASEDGVINLTICIEDHQYQPKNFWNGRWRSIWTVSFSPDVTVAEVSGNIKVQVHYYEDGNVQLVSSKEVKESIKISSEQQVAAELSGIVKDAETEYQMALYEAYETMSDTTFKALRRVLPVTRTKMDWTKILSYRIGTELKLH